MNFIQQKLATDGAVEFDLTGITALNELQNLLRPLTIDSQELLNADFETYTSTVYQWQERVRTSGLVQKLVGQQVPFLSQLLGPDIDVQTSPHIRISRPDKAADVIAWHRDTYYGSSPFEMNIWFPVFDLPTGAAFMVVPGSHINRPAEIKEAQNKDFHVERGSAANKVGYLYAPKTEELIEKLNNEQVCEFHPKVGQAVIFFSSILHRARGGTDGLRISVDVRIRHPFSPTDTKPGYYAQLSRSPIFSAAQAFLSP